MSLIDSKYNHSSQKSTRSDGCSEPYISVDTESLAHCTPDCRTVWLVLAMASFYSLFGFLAVNVYDCSEGQSNFDMISDLPIEVATMIMRSLPAKDLLNASCVSTKWLNICKNDRRLRQKIRRHLRLLRKTQMNLMLNDRFGGVLNSSSSHRTATSNIVNTVAYPDTVARRIYGRPMSMPGLRYTTTQRDSQVRPKRTRPLPRSREDFSNGQGAVKRMRV